MRELPNFVDDCASRNDVAEAVTILEDLYSTARRVFGSNHPLLRAIKFDLERAIRRLGGVDVVEGVHVAVAAALLHAEAQVTA